MVIGATFFVVAALIVFIWVFIEVKRLKHKLFAIFLIGLILFTYISFTVSLKGKDVDFKTVDGIIKAGKLYMSWLGSVFTNIKSITAYASKQDWKEYNESVVNDTSKVEEIWAKL
ncbi:hypothetical protein GW932_00385 [archaeon]|nr:hypothetical protein [archaeon]